jgi:hypothetical protein
LSLEKLGRWGRFTSTQDLSDSEALLRSPLALPKASADRILAFIEYFNLTLAKPFEWKYEGYPEAV